MGHITTRLTRNPEEIESILARDAFDEPIAHFSPALLEYAAREFLAVSPDVFFAVGEWEGEYAGFALGQTLGPGMWRQFARDHVAARPLAILALVFRLKVMRPVRRRLGRMGRPRLSGMASGAESADMPQLGRPFSWSHGRRGTGQVDQLFVGAGRRGLGVAPALLGCLTDAMSRAGVTLVEAHIDPGNIASLRSFLRAGYKAYRASGGDYYVCLQLDEHGPRL